MTVSDQTEIEPERYELRGEPTYLFRLNRRDFLKAVGGGIVVILAVGGGAVAQESGGRRGRGGFRGGEALPKEIGAWLRIGDDGVVTVFTGKAEVGQNIRTSLTQAVAEELRLPIASIQLVMGDTARTPYDMGTFGSRTTPTMSYQLRRVAAAAREALVDLAAEQWKVDRGTLVVADGRVSDPSTHRSADFAALAQGRQLMRVVEAAEALTPPADWKIAGTPALKVDGRAFVTGRHRYAADQARPGMLHGRVVRP